MKNAEKFKEIFKEFATEVWAFPEKDFLEWLNAEYKEPTTNNDLGVDCIDRTELLKAIDTWDKFGFEHTGCFVREPKGNYVTYVQYDDMVNCVKGLPSVIPYMPSVTPQPRKGHWIVDVDKWGDVVTTVNGYKCDKCNAFNSDKDNYCPNCGADMRASEV